MTKYRIETTRATREVLSDHLRMGTAVSPDGRSISVNSLCLLRDGEPWLPVMGEMHFSRYPRRYWEESLLKMKAAGLDIVASYIFWIHHEEVEGEFDEGLTLQITPLARDAEIYIEPPFRPAFDGDSAVELRAVRAVPEYAVLCTKGGTGASHEG